MGRPMTPRPMNARDSGIGGLYTAAAAPLGTRTRSASGEEDDEEDDGDDPRDTDARHQADDQRVVPEIGWRRGLCRGDVDGLARGFDLGESAEIDVAAGMTRGLGFADKLEIFKQIFGLAIAIVAVLGHRDVDDLADAGGKI